MSLELFVQKGNRKSFYTVLKICSASEVKRMLARCSICLNAHPRSKQSRVADDFTYSFSMFSGNEHLIMPFSSNLSAGTG